MFLFRKKVSAQQRFILPAVGQRTDSAITKSNGLWEDYESSHIIPKRVNNIFSFYLANGIQHCHEHHKEHAEHADCHTAPWKHKIDIVRPSDEHSFVNQPRRDCCYGKSEE